MINESFVSEKIRQALSRSAINFKYLFDSNAKPSKPVFIIGSGRSGTHFLAQTLAKNSEIDDMMNGRENPAVFYGVTYSALGMKESFDDVVSYYKKLINICNVEFFLDQSHPNLWFFDDLVANFPDAIFVGITRRPESVIYSTMNHSGTSGWIHNWDRLPFPNQFMGNKECDYEVYKKMSFAEKSALKWMAHYRQMEKAKTALGKKFIHVDYDELAANTSSVLKKIDSFLGLESPTPLPAVKKESMGKWREMSEKDLREIRAICGDYEGRL